MVYVCCAGTSVQWSMYAVQVLVSHMVYVCCAGTSVQWSMYAVQVLVSNVQSRIQEALAKPGTATESLEPLPLPPILPSSIAGNPVCTAFSLVPPPLTSSHPLTFVTKGGSPPYKLPHPAPKRGVVITKLSGPLSSALSQRSREGSRHSSTSSLKSGEDPQLLIQSVKSTASDDAVITGISSSSQPTVITLSPSPTASIEETPVSEKPPSHQKLEQDSDKESDGVYACTSTCTCTCIVCATTCTCTCMRTVNYKVH